MIRIVVLLVILALAGFIVFVVMKLLSQNHNRCRNCNGQGFWKGTRGEKNTCKVCKGSGKR